LFFQCKWQGHTVWWWYTTPLFYCSPDSSTRYLEVVSECELGRLLCYSRVLTNLQELVGNSRCACRGWQNVWHHLPHIYSWVSLQGTSQLTTNKQTNKLFFGGGRGSKGLNCMMQVTVADLSTMTKQWHPFGAADLPQLQRLQKGSLCCKCVPGHWRWPQHSYHTYPTQRALSSRGGGF
jgi:hypothetical protein